MTQNKWLKGLVWGGVLGLASVMVGCSSDSTSKQSASQKQALPVIESKQPIAAKTVWQKQPTSGMEKLQWPLQVNHFDGRIYSTGYGGQVAVLSAESGKVIWKASVGAQLVTGPAMDAHHVFVGTHKGELLALSQDKGQLLWAAALSSVPMATPTVDRSHVYVHTNDNHVTALNTADGSVDWQFGYGTPPLKLHGMSQLTVTEDYVLVGASDGKLLALNKKDGSVAWENLIAMPTGFSELQRLVDINAAPLVANQYVFVATYQGKLAAVHIETGQTLWSRDASVYQSLSFSQGSLYLTDDKGIVQALDASTGAVLWKQEALKNRSPLGPIRMGNYVAVMDSAGYLYHLDSNTGKLLNLEKVTVKISTTPVRYGDTLYLQNDSGQITAINYTS